MTLKFRNIYAVDDLLNGSFQSSNSFVVISVHISFNVTSQNESHFFQIRRVRWSSELLSSGLLVPQYQNAAAKVLLDIKHFLDAMDARSVLHELHLIEIMVTLVNGDESIFQNFHISFSSHLVDNG